MAPTAPRKKLIEVSIPLEAINRESAREKSIRHGHPSTLHLWWARRPLAACRAVLFAQLVDDPSACPEEFPTKQAQDAERDRLHKLIAALVPWEASNNELILNEARYEIARSVARGRGDKLPPIGQMKPRQIIDYLQENAPPVYDPFCGGGSIPLETQRLGLKAMGSDLNPVAVLISKALVEFPPKCAGRKPVNPEVNELHQWKGAQGLADDVRYYGRWMGEEAQKKIGHLYPKVKMKDGKEATVIAWLWARTVPSPDPRAKDAHVPLASSFVLSAKAGKAVIVQPVVDRAKMEWRFKIDEKPSAEALKAAKNGTKAARGSNFTCILTGAAIDSTHVKAEAMSGRMSAALMAIVSEGNRGRVYLDPTPEHTKVAIIEAPDVPEVDQPMPENPRWFSPPDHGMPNYVNLFTPRQLVALTTFSDLVIEAREKVLADAKKHWSGAHIDDVRRLADGGLGPVAYADAVATYLGESVSKLAVFLTTQARWRSGEGKSAPGFGRQALPMVWDFADLNPFAGAGGDWNEMIAACSKVLERLPASSGAIYSRAAQNSDYPNPVIINTDPPYYDNIGYADLSDYFYVWLRRTLHSVHPDLFRRVLTPKADELVAIPSRRGGKDKAEAFFMEEMCKALVGIAQVTSGHFEK
jgi:putative DNA methylase